MPKVRNSFQSSVNASQKKVQYYELDSKLAISFYWPAGKCPKNEACPYIHSPDDVAVCNKFLTVSFLKTSQSSCSREAVLIRTVYFDTRQIKRNFLHVSSFSSVCWAAFFYCVCPSIGSKSHTPFWSLFYRQLFPWRLCLSPYYVRKEQCYLRGM